ncbi:hypothetical protein KTO58_01735 [Chitinophaga pendula]|uniref:hypothetical protein n=1 Tax=Chitinophaga TaxID=79328 RepID=UPI000BAF5339|nr:MULTISPECIES: hypothetical protein [Chitinophaga]ASZ14419.1 hypothetical protein CK934_27485 [Chitinophaga sp. MD30]UCJ07926.1 hypothetical protein KTO58_01735 [Chitinophaga pendula]
MKSKKMLTGLTALPRHELRQLKGGGIDLATQTCNLQGCRFVDACGSIEIGCFCHPIERFCIKHSLPNG